MFNIVEDLDEHFVFRHAEGRRVRVRMRAIVNDAIHVEIETVEFWYAILRYELRDGRIPFAHPSEELWYSHSEGLKVPGVVEWRE